MARLTDIISNIEKLILGITIENDFDYDWGTTQELDGAHKKYPDAEISYESESVVDGSIRSISQFGFSDVTITIRVRVQTEDSESQPNVAIDEVYDNVIRDLKLVLLASNGTAVLTDGSAIIDYVGFKKDMVKSNDIFTPKSVTTTWTVRYPNG